MFCPLEGRGAGVVIRLPPHLYKCGGTEGRDWAAKKVVYITEPKCVCYESFACVGGG